MLVFGIVYVMFQYLVVKFCSKFIVSEISIVPIAYIFGFGFRKYCFKTVVVSSTEHNLQSLSKAALALLR